MHDLGVAVEYCQRSCEVATKLELNFCIIMRAYVEKPRSTVGFKGLAHDPDLTVLRSSTRTFCNLDNYTQTQLSKGCQLQANC
ncbi:hypothetical protein N7454_005308 [Penicillium verhagenii]|nr:hypothetical protein N7454_005308 [Penicillium verhagenii]